MRLSSRWVNLALFGDTIALLASGILLFTTNRAQDAWLYSLHRYAGAALVVLLVPKTRIIFRSLARQVKRGNGDLTTLLGLFLTGLLLLTLALVFAWTLDLLPFYVNLVIYTTALGLHWYAALSLVPFFAWHAYKRWPLPRRAPSAAPGLNTIPLSRRDALGLIGVGVLGVAGGIALDKVGALTRWTRRFTGSREVNSFSGNDFPVTSSEAPPKVDASTWRLRVSGRVAQPFEMSYDELIGMATASRVATVDCTLGWASTQTWRGVSVAQLLERAGTRSDVQQVNFHALTGTFATLSVEEAREALVATHSGDQVLNQAHGFPARLVAPTRRGYHWIKWMSEIVVS